MWPGRAFTSGTTLLLEEPLHDLVDDLSLHDRAV
jgi:hypothetical protein